MKIKLVSVGAVALAFHVTTLSAAEAAMPAADDAALAKKLQNPVASLISVPLQNNVDFGIGPDDGWRYTLNVQPVVPFTLNDDWNLVSRTILPVIHQSDVLGDTTQSGVGDTVQSFFFAPVKPAPGNWIWGAGPVFLLPTATDDRLGAEKWGAGPTAALLRQSGPWTYGMLANHTWSFAGEGGREDVSATFLNPFLSYTTKKQWTFTPVALDATYDWEHSQWTVPVSASVSKLFKIGRQPVSIGAGFRYYAEKPRGGPDWGVKLSVVFLFPK